ATTARTLNGDALATVRNRRDENSVAFQSLQKTLRNVRDSNRRNDLYVEHIYTLMRSPENPEELRFGIDTASDDRYRSRVVDAYVTGTTNGLSKHLETPYAPPGFGAEGSAPWVSGYSPVYDRNNKIVGTIGVGVSARGVLEQLNDMMLGGGCLLAIST